MARFFGTPDGVRVGQFFMDRRELQLAGVHRPGQAGISGTKAEGADSIVVSGGYVDDEDHGSYLIYTGHGGNQRHPNRQIADQDPDAPGNAGLITSMVQGLPVRVVRGKHARSPFAPPVGYVYSGLYSVTSWWMKKGRDGFQIVRFRLDAIDNQTVIEPAPRVEHDPAFASAIVARRIRDTAVAREVKELYDFTCQVCTIGLRGFEARRYAEGAHVRPLGRPHLGADNTENLLCLCPNHHTQLDIGGLWISDDMVAIDASSSATIATLVWRKHHRVTRDNVAYHRSLWPRVRGTVI
ncbi:YDG/SRA domain-containing protein [Microbacterium sp. zg-Y818]|uniref:YDG/SRA domain-containing protein n=1 Tax=unclassified Microbacterium TaxID=2609290 RepID=UPI00214B6E37|nr:MULTISPECIES: YDG/SRA domain-containing protein [unclassified Microbacterium]MCR2799492.1 HNH endonuclease [Microbacterium sp. zg.Y818]WIM21489.1 YDG/SRA domain-containing protein [Microbacterium sp. zg-Y818]